MLWQEMNKVATVLILVSLPAVVGCGARHVAPINDAPEIVAAPARTATEIVAALNDPSNEARALAAASLRRLLAADPGARTNDHGRDYWEKQVAKVEPGMKHAQVVKLLPPHDKTLSEEHLLWSGPGSGQSHYGFWRLDHYWMVSISYRNPDTVLKSPRLIGEALRVWIKPPNDFTGTWVTWYVNGQKSHEFEYKDGKYHGRHSSYRDNGQKGYEQHYVSGMCSGTDTGWHCDGRKSYQGQYESGKREGTWTHWYADGSLQSREELKNGQSHGVRTSWYASGQKRFEVHYREGRKHGLDRNWDKTGKLLWSREYRDGELVRGER